jgi:hypothetical protein
MGEANCMQCADIMFNSSAQLLPDDQCQNGTGVGGVAIANVASETEGGAATPSPTPTGAAGRLSPVVGSAMLAAVLAWGFL